LRKRGELVDLLVILDSHFPGPDGVEAVASADARPLGSALRRHVLRVASLDPEQGFVYVTERLKSRLNHQIAKAKKLFQALSSKAWLQTGRPIPGSFEAQYILGIYDKALRAYKPLPYAGRVVYVKSAFRERIVSVNALVGSEGETIRICPR
jgi:hypothetical protein